MLEEVGSEAAMNAAGGVERWNGCVVDEEEVG